MSPRLTPLILTLALTTTALTTLADTPRPPATAPAMGGDARPGGPRGARGPTIPANLSGAMSEMQRAYNALKTEVADSAKIDQTLRDLGTMQRDIITSKLAIPPIVNRMPAGDKKTESLTDYRAMCNGLLHSLLDLEDAVNDKKPDDIKKYMAEIDDLMKKGHAEFRPGRGG